MKFGNKIKEALGYYIYALVDPRDKKIFYIGKGIGDRIFQHAEDSLNDNMDGLKLDTIRSIHNEGKDVLYYIIRHNLTEESAYLVESVLIDMLSYKAFNKKNLLTNIVSGHHQWDEGIKTIQELNILYDCEKIVPKEGDFLMLVSLNKSYDQSKSEGVYRRIDDYDSTRKYWKIADNRISQITHVLGVYKGIVRTVFKPIKWMAYECADDGTPFKSIRYGFEGIAIPNSSYLNKDVSDFPFGSGGAVTYIPRERKKWF